MINLKTIFAAGLMSFGLALPAVAAEAGVEPIVKQHWSFGGIFGTYDEKQLQRGFQVFREVCAGCHASRLLAFRNLGEEGGPMFSEAQVKALAASYSIADPDAEGGKRPGLPSDRWPGPDQSPADLRASFGIIPPDFSVLAKARTVEPGFPDWLFNYFTTYSEGGPDYIHALLTGYEDPAPADFALPEGKYYNKYFPGHAIGMPPPLTDGGVAYTVAEGETPVPLTAEQYATDVSAFMMWVAEPHLNSTKAAGFKVLTFLILFAVLMWFVKQRIWRNVEH